MNDLLLRLLAHMRWADDIVADALSTGETPEPESVRLLAHIAAVERGTMLRSVVATGKIEPITKVEIKSKASGIVKKLYIEAGDQELKEGQDCASRRTRCHRYKDTA